MRQTSQLRGSKRGKEDEGLKKILRIRVRSEPTKEYVKETEDKLGKKGNHNTPFFYPSSLLHHYHCRIITTVASLPLTHHYHCRIITTVTSLPLSHHYHCRIITTVASLPLSHHYYCRIITTVASLPLPHHYHCRIITTVASNSSPSFPYQRHKV